MLTLIDAAQRARADGFRYVFFNKKGELFMTQFPPVRSKDVWKLTSPVYSIGLQLVDSPLSWHESVTAT